MRQVISLGLLLTGLLISYEGNAMNNCQRDLIKANAIQEIEYLRRWYGKATDKIGEASEASIAEGRSIYHKIFTADVSLDAGPDREPQIGPDAWVDLVLGALGELRATQHLIGTQLVTVESLELDDQCNIISGEASMESYLQAWHERTDEKVWIFIGTYFDKVKYVGGEGWRIYDMKLKPVGGETRYMDSAVGRAK